MATTFQGPGEAGRLGEVGSMKGKAIIFTGMQMGSQVSQFRLRTSLSQKCSCPLEILPLPQEGGISPSTFLFTCMLEGSFPLGWKMRQAPPCWTSGVLRFLSPGGQGLLRGCLGNLCVM